MINSQIDLSASFGPVRDQADRQTCLAFTLSDLSQHRNGSPLHQSVEYVCHYTVAGMKNWSLGEPFEIRAAVKAIDKPGHPDEHLYPYEPHNQARPLDVPPATIGPLITSNVVWKHITAEDVVDQLVQQRPIGVLTSVTETLMRPNGDVVDFSSHIYPNSTHAMIAVGLGTHQISSEQHILVRNSWGPHWGNNGHAWLPLTYLKRHIRGALMVY